MASDDHTQWKYVHECRERATILKIYEWELVKFDDK